MQILSLVDGAAEQRRNGPLPFWRGIQHSQTLAHGVKNKGPRYIAGACWRVAVQSSSNSVLPFDPVNTVIIVGAARAARKFTREAGRAAREGRRAVGMPTGERKAAEEARQPASSATRTSMENPTRTSLDNPLSLSQFPLDVVNFWQQVNSWEKLTILPATNKDRG